MPSFIIRHFLVVSDLHKNNGLLLISYYQKWLSGQKHWSQLEFIVMVPRWMLMASHHHFSHHQSMFMSFLPCMPKFMTYSLMKSHGIWLGNTGPKYILSPPQCTSRSLGHNNSVMTSHSIGSPIGPILQKGLDLVLPNDRFILAGPFAKVTKWSYRIEALHTLLMEVLISYNTSWAYFIESSSRVELESFPFSHGSDWLMGLGAMRLVERSGLPLVGEGELASHFATVLPWVGTRSNFTPVTAAASSEPPPINKV